MNFMVKENWLGGMKGEKLEAWWKVEMCLEGVRSGLVAWKCANWSESEGREKESWPWVVPPQRIGQIRTARLMTDGEHGYCPFFREAFTRK